MSDWAELEIGGHAADAYSPPQPSGGAVLILPGYYAADVKEHAAFTSALAKHGMHAICPRGGASFWTDAISPEFDPRISPLEYLRQQVVPVFARRWGIEPPRIGLLGIEIGGQGVLQLAYRSPREFPAVAAISPIIDFHLWYGHGLPLDRIFPDAEAARQATAVLQIHPLNWPKHQLLLCDRGDPYAFDGTERLASKMSSTGIPFEAELHSNQGGHGWDYFDSVADRAVSYLAQHIPQ